MHVSRCNVHRLEPVGGRVRENHVRLEATCLLIWHRAISHYYYYVTGKNLACCRPVKAYNPRTAFAGNGICFQTFAVVVIDDINMLTRGILAASIRFSSMVILPI